MKPKPVVYALYRGIQLAKDEAGKFYVLCDCNRYGSFETEKQAKNFITDAGLALKRCAL